MTRNGYIVVNYPAPVANFNPASASGRAPYTVSFTDTSSNPTGWLWSFGDGTTDTARNPTHTYTNAGKYTVSLTATNPSGSNTKTVADMVTRLAGCRVHGHAHQWQPAASTCSLPTKVR